MIEKIDVQNFGCFRGLEWDSSVRDGGNNIASFKKLNIIYGRNYAGKTTLANIFRSLETGNIPREYKQPSFSAITESGAVSESDIPSTDYDVRVYNTDFVEQHLSFLQSPDGTITPIAVIGKENKKTEEEVAAYELELGNGRNSRGLRYEQTQLQRRLEKKTEEKIAAEKQLRDQLTKKATNQTTGIKYNDSYTDRNYSRPKLEKDVETVRINGIVPLSAEQVDEVRRLLREETLPTINKLSSFRGNLAELHSEADSLAREVIRPTKPLQELLDDAVLQAWVKDGISLHREHRSDCGFCGRELPPEIWEKLDNHFGEESGRLESEISRKISELVAEKVRIEGLSSVSDDSFYSSLKDPLRKARKQLEEEIGRYVQQLDGVVVALRERSNDIFNPKLLPELVDNSKQIQSFTDGVNSLVEQNNRKTETLNVDQDAARDRLRLSEVAQFVSDIDLDSREKDLKGLATEAIETKKELKELDDKVREKEERIAHLLSTLQDERRGADRINELLQNFFGHHGLRLEAQEDAETAVFRFKIFRGDEVAYKLSEGECSLVAFCYFVARLEDSNATQKRRIIYIDDPVSSLDGNHIFFVFSLIESLIARPERDSTGEDTRNADGKVIFRYHQLFISTHNLEFLKYLKKLRSPGKGKREYFMLRGHQSGSAIELMPKYLRNYVTEFNFLFNEICTCAADKPPSEKSDSFYNFGNNLRKFLEIFLFFKFPYTEDESDTKRKIRRIEEFFDDEPETSPLVQRIVNEFSHLGTHMDRGMQPVDHMEMSKLAEFVLRAIRRHDGRQYECLLESIQRDDPLSADSS